MKYKLINKQTNKETLCDKVTIDGYDYYAGGNYKDGDYVILPLTNTLVKCVNGTTFIEGTQKVIATNNPNIDIPKVMDGVDLDNLLGEWKYKLGLKESKDKADENFEKGYFADSVKDKISHRFGYVYGMKEAEKRLVPIIMELKVQETHPFSEEDMIEFGQWVSRNDWVYLPSRERWVNEDREGLEQKLSSQVLLQIWKEERIKTLYYE